MKKDPGESELSKRESELIKEIDEKYKNFDQWEMVDICHKILPEWENPGTTSILIQIKDILKATDKTDREIAIIEDEMANLEYCDFLLSTGR